MLHPRTLLRHVVAARLAGGRDDGSPWTAAGSRVLLARRLAADSGVRLPVLLVHGGGEEIAEASYPIASDSGLIRRTGLLIIDCVVAADDHAEDVLDALAAGVEAALEWFEPPGQAHTTLRLLRSDPPVWGCAPEHTATGRLWLQIRHHQPYRVPPSERTAP